MVSIISYAFLPFCFSLEKSLMKRKRALRIRHTEVKISHLDSENNTSDNTYENESDVEQQSDKDYKSISENESSIDALELENDIGIFTPFYLFFIVDSSTTDQIKCNFCKKKECLESHKSTTYFTTN